MVPRKFCIICENIIPRKGDGIRNVTKRQKKSITCSKRCSRIYTRISIYIRDSKFYKDGKKIIKKRN